jgi:hypothetical protein
VKLDGLRVHIAGSAAHNCDEGLLGRAHRYVAKLVELLASQGAGLIVGVGDEPHGEAGLALIFDWTALETADDAAAPRIEVVASQRGLDRIPGDRVELWNRLSGKPAFELWVAPAGWRMGGVLREEQVRRGDVLIALGGGAGVEHLAALYRDEGKAVVPVRAELGAINDDGNGGSSYLHGRALNEPDGFAPGTGAARLARLTLDVEPDALAALTIEAVAAIEPPRAFYVRLLASDHGDFAAVEAFFRDIVDPVVIAAGYRPHEVGRDDPLAAFLNVEIFEGLHRAGVCIVDLTGVRPNCLMELGYALGRRRRVVVTAMADTPLPFDADKLRTFLWSRGESDIDRFGEWFARVLDLPPLVEARR